MLRKVEFIGSGYEVVRFVMVDTDTMVEAYEAAKKWYEETGQDFHYCEMEIPKEYAYNETFKKDENGMSKDQAAEAKRLLQSFTYDEMNKKQMALVVAYETEEFKSKVDELIKSGMSVAEIEEEIHDWWLDYQMADGTETALYGYLNEKINDYEVGVDVRLTEARERSGRPDGIGIGIGKGNEFEKE